MPSGSGSNFRSTGAPFAKPFARPWQAAPPRGLFALIAFTVTIFFRSDFGERYLTPSALPKAMFWICGYLVILRFYVGHWSVNGGVEPVPFNTLLTWGVFAILFLILVVRELLRATRRRTMFPDEHSQSDGHPRKAILHFMPFLDDEWDFERFYEPAICIIAGAVMLHFHNLMGLYFIIAGSCAFLVARKKYRMRRDFELDALDARTSSLTQPTFEDNIPLESIRPIPAQAPEPRRNREQL